ncbi:hypothetical protein KI387_008469, partial [Taxus chinensis]
MTSSFMHSRFDHDSDNQPSTQRKKDEVKKAAFQRPTCRYLNKSDKESKVFVEECTDQLRRRILDPRTELVQRWNKIFLISSLVSLFLIPLYFYMSSFRRSDACMQIDKPLAITVTVLHSITDLFYILHMIVKFRTAYVAPSSRVFGKGDLVVDPTQIAKRYFRTDFFLDLTALLPLPQMMRILMEHHKLWKFDEEEEETRKFKVGLPKFKELLLEEERHDYETDLAPVESVVFMDIELVCAVLRLRRRMTAMDKFRGIIVKERMKRNVNARSKSCKIVISVNSETENVVLQNACFLNLYISKFTPVPFLKFGRKLLIWLIIPALRSSKADHTKNFLALIVLFQYLPRLLVIFPLTSENARTTGVVTKTAWAAAAYNLLLYMIASHVLGASWYFLATERQNTCWLDECRKENGTSDLPKCQLEFLDCESLSPAREKWMNITSVLKNCNASDKGINFQYGIYGDAWTSGIVSSKFIEKYFYCFWWGLKNLSSLGQNPTTSTSIGETSFGILIIIVGLVLFAHLIGNMQTSLRSLTVRLDEWRIKRRDTEEWMRHRQLPEDLCERVQHYVQYKWIATRGVNEETLLRSLPKDLRRDIQRHLCLNLVRR